MNTRALTLLVVVLGLTIISGCGAGSQTEGEPTSGSPVDRPAPETAPGGPQTEDDGGGGAEAGGAAVTIEVGGSPGTEFLGRCVVGDGGFEELDGRTPQTFTYDARGERLECELASEGNLEVVLTHDGTRSVQRISGGTLSFVYENGSISSSTSSSSRVAGEGPGGATDGSEGVVGSEARDVSGFDRVELRGAGNLSIRQTGTESLMVEAEEDVLSKIQTQVVDGRLIIGPEPGTSIQTTEPISYELTVTALRGLDVSGSGSIDAQGIDADELAVAVSGAADVRMSGRAGSQEVDITGSGTYEARDLRSDRIRIGIEGTGSAVVNASEELDATVSGAGSVEYEGNPSVRQDVSGVGRVSKH